MALTPEIVDDILRVYKQTRSPFKTANKVGVDVAEVLSVVSTNEERLSAAPERHGGFGRPEIKANLVARRKASQSSWDNDLPEIVEARENFEKGTHIMATGRDGAWLLLYSFKRKGRPDPLIGYFIPDVA